MTVLSFIQFIVEDRIQTLKMLHPALDTSHDTHGQHKGSELIDHFANHDPTKNKQYTQWMINRYKEKNFRQEDLGRVKQALADFHQHKGKLEKKDINQYKKVSAVEDAVEPHLGTVSKKQEKAQIKHEGAELIHDHDGVTVHQLKTKEAACHYGAGTKWCTAAKNNNMFDHYNKDGPLHVIQHQGRKYQFHNHSNQFMDEKDDHVAFETVHPDIAKSLAKSTHPEIMTHSLLYENEHNTKRHIDFGIKHPNPDVRNSVFASSAVTTDHISHLANDEKSLIRAEAVGHPKATSEIIKQGMNDKNLYVKEKAIRNQNATHEHIDIALDHTIHPPSIGAIAASRSNASEQNLTKAMKHPNAMVRIAAIHNPNSTKDHIKAGLKDKNSDVKFAAQLEADYRESKIE